MKLSLCRDVLTALALLLASCQRPLPPAEFIQAYEIVGQVMKEKGDYKLRALALSPEYLLAKQIDSSWSGEKIREFRESYKSVHYVAFQISLANPTNGPDDIEKDFVAGTLLQGQEAYQRRLDFLQNEVGAFVHLETKDGRNIEPLSYRFERGFNLGGPHQFVFLFPKTKDGKAVSLEHGRLIVHDFGLNIGTESFPLRLPENLVLKVQNA